MVELQAFGPVRGGQQRWGRGVVLGSDPLGEIGGGYRFAGGVVLKLLEGVSEQGGPAVGSQGEQVFMELCG